MCKLSGLYLYTFVLLFLLLKKYIMKHSAFIKRTSFAVAGVKYAEKGWKMKL